MGRIPTRVDVNTLEQIRLMAMEGRSRKQIASKLNLKEGVIKWQMDKNNIPLQTSQLGTKKPRKKKVEYGDFDKLDEDILFDYKNF
jgi:hypothetical protein